MQKLFEAFKMAVFANPYTTLIALAGVLALGVYYKQLSGPQVIQFLLMILLGGTAADGGGQTKQ